MQVDKSTYKIRQVHASDSYDLIRLLVPQFSSKSKSDLENNTYYLKWHENFENMVNSTLANSFIAINKDSGLVGVITTYLLPRLELGGYYSVIEDMYVAEIERSKGVGSLLLNHAIDFLKLNNCKYITLNVDPENPKVQNFYTKHGFKNSAMEMRLDLDK